MGLCNADHEEVTVTRRTVTSIHHRGADGTPVNGCGRTIPHHLHREPVLPDGGMLFLEMAQVFPHPGPEGPAVAQKLVYEIVELCGAFRELHSDQGTNFGSKVVLEVCLLLGIHKTKTTPYHPQSDGFIEQIFRTLGRCCFRQLEPRALPVPLRSGLEATTREGGVRGLITCDATGLFFLFFFLSVALPDGCGCHG